MSEEKNQVKQFTENELRNFLSIAQELVLSAGNLALSSQHNLAEVKEKSPNDLVTSADLACDKLIREGLIKSFPNHGLITEESEDINSKSPLQWHVDPIDGTNNFANGLPIWGVSVGLSYFGVMQVGLVFLPALNEFYYAIKDLPAYANGSEIRVSDVSLDRGIFLSNGINVGRSRRHQTLNNDLWMRQMVALAESVATVRCYGAAVFAGLMVAKGCATAYLVRGCKSWDLAAVSLIVESAGGRVTDFKGAKLDLSQAEKGAILSNSLVHQDILDKLICE